MALPFSFYSTRNSRFALLVFSVHFTIALFNPLAAANIVQARKMLKRSWSRWTALPNEPIFSRLLRGSIEV
jgi:hypothetical protein